MKIRPLILFAMALFFLGPVLQAAKAPKLETLLGEYKKARSDVLAKLNEAYAGQAEMLAQQLQAVSNLEGVDRAKKFAKRLRNPDERNDIYSGLANGGINDPVAELQGNYATAREANLNNVYVFYASTAENLRHELLRTKDEAGANVIAEFLAKIKPPGKAAVAAGPTPSKSRTAGSK
ncbi:MAG TPA: hypothetical protein VGM54_19475 [Chthoniobacter sp.]